jgi:hypothetical protein
MRFICLSTIAAILSASAFGGKCGDVDIPVSFTISPTYADPSNPSMSFSSGILDDGLGAYVHGQAGVNALIHTCNGSNGTTLETGSGSRYVTWDFRSAVYTNSLTPSWTQSPVRNTGFTFANLLYNYSPTTTYSFTTYIQYARFQSMTYGFWMQNPGATAPFNPPEANINDPCITSLVKVTHVQVTDHSKETWIVWPDSTPASCTSQVSGSHGQVGTLRTPPKHGPTWVNAGQFTVPFYIVIQRL